jgi:DNA-binding transcriptional ArsR family regulator
MDDTFTAIADPTRRALIDALRARNDSSLFDLCARLMSECGIAVSRQAISKHIAVLEAAGLVNVRKTGRTNIHHLDTTRLAEVTAWLTAHTNPQEEA